MVSFIRSSTVEVSRLYSSTLARVQESSVGKASVARHVVVAPAPPRAKYPEMKNLSDRFSGTLLGFITLYADQPDELRLTVLRTVLKGMSHATKPTPRPPKRRCSSLRRSEVRISPSTNESPINAMRTSSPEANFSTRLSKRVTCSVSKFSIATLLLSATLRSISLRGLTRASVRTSPSIHS